MTPDADNKIWDAYNYLLLGKDIERLRTLTVRADLFHRVTDVPGDIVECGVFKGAGLMLWPANKNVRSQAVRHARTPAAFIVKEN